MDLDNRLQHNYLSFHHTRNKLVLFLVQVKESFSSSIQTHIWLYPPKKNEKILKKKNRIFARNIVEVNPNSQFTIFFIIPIVYLLGIVRTYRAIEN